MAILAASRGSHPSGARERSERHKKTTRRKQEVMPGGWWAGLLKVFWAIVVGCIGQILAFVRASINHKRLRVTLHRPDVEFISATPPAPHCLDMLGVATDGE